MTNFEARSDREARADCRTGRHMFGAAQHVGGGIVRRVCLTCPAVSIDLRSADVPVDGGIVTQRGGPSGG